MIHLSRWQIQILNILLILQRRPRLQPEHQHMEVFEHPRKTSTFYFTYLSWFILLLHIILVNTFTSYYLGFIYFYFHIFYILALKQSDNIQNYIVTELMWLSYNFNLYSIPSQDCKGKGIDPWANTILIKMNMNHPISCLWHWQMPDTKCWTHTNGRMVEEMCFKCWEPTITCDEITVCTKIGQHKIR